MAETLKDINAVVNVGGALTHFNGAQGGGGELTPYDATPVGGPPEINVDGDVRARLTYTITTRVVGADAATREAFAARFNRGTIFSCKETPAGANDMYISGEPDAIGKDFVVMNRTPNHQFQQNSELTVVLEEKAPTAAA